PALTVTAIDGGEALAASTLPAVLPLRATGIEKAEVVALSPDPGEGRLAPTDGSVLLVAPSPLPRAELRLVDMDAELDRSLVWLRAIGRRITRAAALERALSRMPTPAYVTEGQRDGCAARLRALRIGMEDLVQHALHDCAQCHRYGEWDNTIIQKRFLLTRSVGLWDQAFADLLKEWLLGAVFDLAMDGLATRLVPSD